MAEEVLASCKGGKAAHTGPMMPRQRSPSMGKEGEGMKGGKEDKRKMKEGGERRGGGKEDERRKEGSEEKEVKRR